jgi:hypothetical protein
MRHVSILAAIAAVSISSSALASVTVDGTRDAAYGAPIVVQTVQTQFGDANPQQGNQGGSELNAAYARIEGGRLFVMLTGNIEPNFNKLNVFIDSKAGGENVLSREPGYDFGPGNGFFVTQNMGGMTFDAAFAADYHLIARTGAGKAEVDFADRQGGANYSVPNSAGAGSSFAGLVSTGSIAAGAAGVNASGSPLTQPLHFAHNNNNSAGVTGGTDAADQVAAAAVTTGFEFSVDLVDIGNPGAGETIRIAAMIGNGDHHYLSNQILGGLPAPKGNLGGDGNGGFTGTLSGVNFNNFAGEQYFSIVVPEPSTLGLAGVAGLAALRRRRA